jgi:hypothetical protein
LNLWDLGKEGGIFGCLPMFAGLAMALISGWEFDVTWNI